MLNGEFLFLEFFEMYDAQSISFASSGDAAQRWRQSPPRLSGTRYLALAGRGGPPAESLQQRSHSQKQYIVNLRLNHGVQSAER
jgi:hypothetical protein